MNHERRLGFHILGLLDYNNTWNGHQHGYMPHRKLSVLIPEFASYVRHVVLHFRGRIEYWQIWNEPDMHHFWAPHPHPADYARLLATAYRVVKATDPRAKVVMGGPSGSDPHALQFIHKVVRAGGRFDILSIQPYQGTPDVRLIHEVNSVRRYGRPIWFTEMGWAGESWCKNVCGSERSQAGRLSRLYVLAALAGVQRVFWYDLRDDGIGADFEDHFGLVQYRFGWKPAFTAYQLSRHYLDWGSILGVDRIRSHVYAIEIRNHKRVALVVWNDQLTPYHLYARWQGPAMNAIDGQGNELAHDAAGLIDVTIGSRSVAYIAPGADIPVLAHPGRYRLPPGQTWPPNENPTPTPTPVVRPTPTRVKPTPTRVKPTPTHVTPAPTRVTPSPTPTRILTPTPTRPAPAASASAAISSQN